MITPFASMVDRSGVSADGAATGIISSVLSKRIKKCRNDLLPNPPRWRVRRPSALRNIELVKSLDWRKQEVGRLNGITAEDSQTRTQEMKYLRH